MRRKSRKPSRLFSPEYWESVRKTGPIAYWMLDENVGAVSWDISRNELNGTYVGPTLGRSGIGDGKPAPFFDGINDRVQIPTMVGLFNGAEGTVLEWIQVNSLATWADGTTRYGVRLARDANNGIRMNKTGAGVFSFRYRAGGVSNLRNVGGLTAIDPLCACLTWSASAGGTGEVRAYLNGIQQGGTMVGLGVWAGDLVAALTQIGASSNVPANLWHGGIGHSAVWNRPLPPAEIRDKLYLPAFDREGRSG